MKSLTKSSQKKIPKCKMLLQEQIRKNIKEYKQGRFVSRAQAIAVAYSQVSKQNPYCRRHLRKKPKSKSKKTKSKSKKTKSKSSRKKSKSKRKKTKSKSSRKKI